MQIRYDEEGLNPPLIQEQVEQIKRKEGSGRPGKITDKEVIDLMEACTLNKTQRSFSILCLKKRASLMSTVE